MFRILLLLFFASIGSSAQIAFTKLFSIDKNGTPLSPLESADGGFLLAVQNGGVQAQYADSLILIIKTDSSGNLIWSKSFGNILMEEIIDLLPTSDNGFAMVLNVHSNVTTYSVFAVIKCDASGNIIWTKFLSTYSGAGAGQSTVLRNIIETHDHGFIVSGNDRSTTTINQPFLARLDSAGNILWNYTFLMTNVFWENAIELQSGKILLHGFMSGTNFESFMIWIDAAGSILTARKYAVSGKDFMIQHATESQNGNLLLSVNYDNTIRSVLLCNADSSGTPLNMMHYFIPGVTLIASEIFRSDSSNSIVTVAENGPVHDFIYINFLGDSIRTANYNLTMNLAGSSSCMTPCGDGGFVTAGFYLDSTANNAYVALIKTDALLQAPCGNNHPSIQKTQIAPAQASPLSYSLTSPIFYPVDSIFSGNHSVDVFDFCDPTELPENKIPHCTVYPNPFIEQLSFSLTNYAGNEFLLEIFNIYGQVILKSKMEPSLNTIQLKNISGGIYFYELKDKDGFFARGRIVKD